MHNVIALVRWKHMLSLNIFKIIFVKELNQKGDKDYFLGIA